VKIVGVIPARWGSTRFPGKSLAPICGKPLIQWVVEAALRAKSMHSLVVATDDERIMDVVRKLGVTVVMTKPDHPSGTDRIAEAVRNISADVVINIQGDEPLIDPKLIDNIAGVMQAGEKWDMATAAAPISSEGDLVNPAVVKVVWDAKGKALYFSRSVIPFVREKTESANVRHWRHIGIYAYTKAFLGRFVKTPPCALEQAEKLEQLRALHIGGRIAVIQANEAGIGVDRPEDVKYVEEVIRRRESEGEGIADFRLPIAE
jgi:3-deoxy-manno-octulosonate cytidylyltransferase (CMP-KDO synthetase)